MSEIKEDLMSQERMDDAKQSMSDDENGLLVPFSVRSLFHVNLLKVGIGSYDCHGHQERDTSHTFISLFRDVAATFPIGRIRRRSACAVWGRNGGASRPGSGEGFVERRDGMSLWRERLRSSEAKRSEESAKGLKIWRNLGKPSPDIV